MEPTEAPGSEASQPQDRRPKPAGVGPSQPLPGSPGLSLRGHHFLCALHYRGAGYDHAFTANFTRLVEGVAQAQRQMVEVASMADPICSACPQLQSDGQSCASQESVMNRDQALLGLMGWKPGQVLDLEAAQWAVLARRGELMQATCQGCEWLPRCESKGPYGVASPLARPGALEATGPSAVHNMHQVRELKPG